MPKTDSSRGLSGVLLANGTVPLTANWNMGAFSATFTKTGATAATVYDGFIATNTTTASAANQMYGGAFHSIGQGWKTTATAASQSVDFRWYTIPVQGSAAPNGTLSIDLSINAGTANNTLNLSPGVLGATAANSGSLDLFGCFRIQQVASTGTRYGMFNGGNGFYHEFMDNSMGVVLFHLINTASYLNTPKTFFGGTTTATARIHIAAGTATASTSPLKFTSGTNLTTGEAGAMEYNGTNLFFTRTGTTRENVLVGNDGGSAPGTSVLTAFVNYYGTGGTVALSTPNSWASVVIGGVTYKIPLYT